MNRSYAFATLLLSAVVGCRSSDTGIKSQSLPPTASTVRFAVIGDYGVEGDPARDVAALVTGWSPDFILTVGDNNYPDGAEATIDKNIGQYYHSFIGDYQGTYGPGSAVNRFFPSLGNHDWHTPGAQPYLNYFSLPGIERYYDFVVGPVHFFALDSDPHEPDGVASNSTQALWLQAALSASTAPWQVVYFHHAPYSSAAHGPTTEMQWPFAAWGADVVLAGHDHTYERMVNPSEGLTYFVNGLGGNPTRYAFRPDHALEPGSQARYNCDYGAMIVEATTTTMTFRFVTRTGVEFDPFTLTAATPP